MLENETQSFLQLPAIDNIVQYASVASTMLHTEAQSSALRFLLVLTDVADPNGVNTCYVLSYLLCGRPNKPHYGSCPSACLSVCPARAPKSTDRRTCLCS